MPDYRTIQPETSLYEVNDRGKAHYEQKYSQGYEWKAAKTLIPPKSVEPRKEGKKVIRCQSSGHDEARPGVKMFPELRFKASDVNEKMCEQKKIVMMDGQKGTDYEGQRVPRKFRRGEDWPMEQYMNRKQRPLTLERKRNGISEAVPGILNLSEYFYQSARKLTLLL